MRVLLTSLDGDLPETCPETGHLSDVQSAGEDKRASIARSGMQRMRAFAPAAALRVLRIMTGLGNAISNSL